MVKNIALWGYGYHGKDVEYAILTSHTDKYRITAIFDARFGELNPIMPEHNILDPSKIEDYYKKGLFDAVKITVYNRKQKERIAIRLNAMGIPVDDDDEVLSNSSLFRDGFKLKSSLLNGDYAGVVASGVVVETPDGRTALGDIRGASAAERSPCPAEHVCLRCAVSRKHEALHGRIV